MTKGVLQKRVDAFNTGDPKGSYYVVHAVLVHNAADVERKLHFDFRNERLVGEWFSISHDAVVTALDAYADAPLIWNT